MQDFAKVMTPQRFFEFAVLFSFMFCGEYDLVFSHTAEHRAAAGSFIRFKTAAATPFYFFGEVYLFIVVAGYFESGAK